MWLLWFGGQNQNAWRHGELRGYSILSSLLYLLWSFTYWNATRQVSRKSHYKVLTEAVPTLVSVICQTALTISQRGFPVREVIEGSFEQACNIGLKSNKNSSRGSHRTRGKKQRHEEGQHKVEFWRLDMKEDIHVCGTWTCWMSVFGGLLHHSAPQALYILTSDWIKWFHAQPYC